MVRYKWHRPEEDPYTYLYDIRAEKYYHPTYDDWFVLRVEYFVGQVGKGNYIIVEETQ